MRITHAIVAGLLLASSVASADDPDLSSDERRRAWLSDYAGLKASMQQGYANLDWIVAHRDLDLVRLDRETGARLEAATSQAEALAALKDFVGAFHDPHLEAHRGKAPPEALRNAAGLPPEDADGTEGPVSQSCADLGYKEQERPGRFRLAKIPGWSPVASPYFAAGTSGAVGYIRIKSFVEQAYLAACEHAWAKGRTERGTQLATRAELQHELGRLAALLANGGAKVLAIDITENGGGSEWSEEAARLFTARRLTRPSPVVVHSPCDRSGVWRGEKVCANLPAGAKVDRLKGRGFWKGPLAVLVDRNSASASEDFAYWLSGSDVAVLVGERTFGAGCGYMDGGWAFQFTAVDAYLMMPNCSRYTAAGVNQVEGLEPDVAYDWAQGPEGLTDVLANLRSHARLPASQ